MHGHTGFLITTRRLAPGVVPPERKRRPAKGAYGDATDAGVTGETEGRRRCRRRGRSVHGRPGIDRVDRHPGGRLEPEDIGERVKSDKTIRRVRRSLAETSDDIG